jgi:glycosyltransferase involved in cell wall biosynthesis
MAASDAERREMGERGHRLVEAKYTWDAVVKAMIEGYEEILTQRHSGCGSSESSCL